MTDEGGVLAEPRKQAYALVQTLEAFDRVAKCCRASDPEVAWERMSPAQKAKLDADAKEFLRWLAGVAQAGKVLE